VTRHHCHEQGAADLRGLSLVAARGVLLALADPSFEIAGARWLVNLRSESRRSTATRAPVIYGSRITQHEQMVRAIQPADRRRRMRMNALIGSHGPLVSSMGCL